MKDVDEVAINQDYYEMVKRIYLEPALKNKDRLKFLINDIERIKVYDKIKDFVREN